ncbi:MAG: M50 family metallopeptidase [Bacteroidales bacterium]|nr:M50 family metallopeptidase [Bacteroidales bacterium]
MSKEESILFLSMALLAFLAGRIPYFGKFLRVFHTLFHEGGHVLAAWISGGEVLRIELFHDTSGTTISKSSTKSSMIFVSLAGYVFASFTAFLFVFLLSMQLSWLLHAIILSLSIVLLFKGVKNTFGVFWILLLLSAYFAILFFYPEKSWMLIYAFSGLMVYESVFSAFQILLISIVKPSAAGDASNLAQATVLPTPIWGIIFFAQALTFTWLSIQLLFK